MDETIRRAADLWPKLISQAGLTGASKRSDGAYDRELIEALRLLLFPSDHSDTPMAKLLARSSLSAEALVRAFFATLAPFASMKVDILTMLSNAGAKGSGDALRIRFNFDPKQEPLDLLLNEFREQMDRIAEATVERPRVSLPPDLWSIKDVGMSGSARQPMDRSPSMERWERIYTDGDAFEPLPQDWKTGRDDIDARLGRVAELTNSVLLAFRRYAANRSELRAVRDNPQLLRTSDPIGLTVVKLWQLDADFWPRAMANWMAERRYDAKIGNEDALQRMMKEIDELLPPSDETEVVRRLVRQLEDLLNLPVWKRRNDVYAVWLGAQIYLSLESQGWRFRFHLQDNRLEFAFRGVHLATLFGQTDSQLLFWWTELRSLHKNLPSGHRTSGIQPDYRIRRAPLSEPDTDILVVEAKQHLRSATREFTNAVRDYAFACPQAVVLLANYGPIVSSASEAVEPAFKDRIQFHDLVHPGELANVAIFRSAITETVSLAVGVPRRRLENPVSVRLSWGPSPRDLDLHVLSERDAAGHAYYSQPDVAGVRLSRDIQSGFGPEIAEIEPSDSTYIISVNHFSNDGWLSASEAKIEIWCTGNSFTPITLEVPVAKSGRWWHVARIDMVSGSIEGINRVDDIPLV